MPRITQKEIAGVVGVSQATVSGWQLGRNPSWIDVAAKVVSTDRLYGEPAMRDLILRVVAERDPNATPLGSRGRWEWFPRTRGDRALHYMNTLMSASVPPHARG